MFNLVLLTTLTAARWESKASRQVWLHHWDHWDHWDCWGISNGNWSRGSSISMSRGSIGVSIGRGDAKAFVACRAT